MVLAIKTKPYIFVLSIILALVLIIGGVKYAQIKKQKSAQFLPPPASINVTTVVKQDWTTSISAVGTVFSERGVTLSAEVVGAVESIHFLSGDSVEEGTLLLTQDRGNELAQLESANAQLRLAESTFNRNKRLLAQGTVSQSAYETAQQTLESARAKVQDIQSTLNKKNIRAPFSGKLGIRKVDLGQELFVGDAIVELQALDKLKVNFNVPQRWFSELKPGLNVTVHMLDNPSIRASGVINAIDSKVDEQTRSIEVQATLDSQSSSLLPGMAVEVNVATDISNEYLVVPVTAIVYAPFGDTVFIIEENAESKKLSAKQQFVKIAERRGDYVAIAAGVNEHDRVASSGAFKLFSGQPVSISENEETNYSLNPEPNEG